MRVLVDSLGACHHVLDLRKHSHGEGKQKYNVKDDLKGEGELLFVLVGIFHEEADKAGAEAKEITKELKSQTDPSTRGHIAKGCVSGLLDSFQEVNLEVVKLTIGSKRDEAVDYHGKSLINWTEEHLIKLL